MSAVAVKRGSGELRASHCCSEEETPAISPRIGSVCFPVIPSFHHSHHHHHSCLHTRCHWHQLTPLWCNRSTGIWNTKRSMFFAGFEIVSSFHSLRELYWQHLTSCSHCALWVSQHHSVNALPLTPHQKM